jgi:hypothetical protein
MPRATVRGGGITYSRHPTITILPKLLLQRHYIRLVSINVYLEVQEYNYYVNVLYYNPSFIGYEHSLNY